MQDRYYPEDMWCAYYKEDCDEVGNRPMKEISYPLCDGFCEFCEHGKEIK